MQSQVLTVNNSIRGVLVAGEGQEGIPQQMGVSTLAPELGHVWTQETQEYSLPLPNTHPPPLPWAEGSVPSEAESEGERGKGSRGSERQGWGGSGRPREEASRARVISATCGTHSNSQGIGSGWEGGHHHLSRQ